MTVFHPRRAARVLLVDASGRVLLFAGTDPARPGHRYWFTPGGGLTPGESPAAGAARELAEETGLRLTQAELGRSVRSETIEFPFDGVWYRQEQEFFVFRVPAWEVDTAGFDEIERASVTGHRWWSAAELADTAERCYPADLADLLTQVVGAAPASEPSC
ncbi:NUDIX domain-containing protein [Micromonospora sp. HM134]|uniref:NUDIX hydrolase n=1 Tax=Micromonospora sp. HM134 TaxID=2583243 RepID=UPI00119897BC|nr:NUDIX domain-containing protein [Micromonospora sp. HM134]QDY07024.1 NUDIX domain-containing protein [Micromonospora sp. HM134]